MMLWLDGEKVTMKVNGETFLFLQRAEWTRVNSKRVLKTALQAQLNQRRAICCLPSPPDCAYPRSLNAI